MMKRLLRCLTVSLPREPDGATRHELVVPAELDGQRADRIVATLLDISRAAARRAVDRSEVKSGGIPLAPAQRLSAGTRLIVVRPSADPGPRPLDRPLQVVYESPHCLVVEKPAGLVVHPGAGHRDDTLVNVLIHHYPELAGLSDEYRWGLVHRLDRDTSGLLIVARRADAHTALQAQLKRRDIERTYHALVTGRLEPATGTVEAPIGRDPGHPTKMALRHDGRFARTHYRRLASWHDATLLEVRLETGRTHQIRVHLASIGAPIVGDKTYGGRSDHRADPGRVWLHASVLRFRDPGLPATAEPVVVRSPLPVDLQSSLDQLGAPEEGAIAESVPDHELGPGS